MGIGPRARMAWLIVVAGAAALSGCGGGGRAPVARAVLGIAERDFHISASPTVGPGTFTLRVHNAGPDTHELFVVRARSAKLPLRADGLTVDEDAIARVTA